MNDYELVSELVSKTGATFEEARYAYESCGKDMLAAAIMLEKAKSASKNNKSTPNSASAAKDTFRRNARTAANCAGGFFRKLCRNTLKISGSREFFSVPLIAALITALFIWEILIPVVIISVFCGIKYTFCGPDFAENFTFGFEKPYNSADNSRSTAAEYTYEQPIKDNGFFKAN